MRFLRQTASLLALISCGCAGTGTAPTVVDPHPSGQGSSRTIVTPSSSVAGLVISVDIPSRFVVVSFPPGRVPEKERRYHLYRRGLKAGEVRIGGPRTGDNTVADILTGDAEVGDEARPE